MILRRRAAWVLLAMMVGTYPSAGAPDRTDAGLELQVLERFIGRWDVAITVKPGLLVPAGVKARGSTTNAWSDDKRTVRQAWSIESNDGKPLISGRTDLSYDAQRRVFRSVTTLPQVPPSESEGKYDAPTRTFTWITRDPKTKATTTAKSSSSQDGVEVWSMNIQDAQNRVVFECHGVNTRRRKA